MKSIVFDSGPLISLTMSNLLWILEPVARRFPGKLVITHGVKEEVIDKPMRIKRFQFGAFQVLEKVNEGTFHILHDQKVSTLAHELLDAANAIFSSHEKNIHIVDLAEMETLAAGLLLNADAVVVDERITRYLIEDPHAIHKILERRLHKSISFDGKRLRELHDRIKSLAVVRSTELAVRVLELGVLDHLIPPKMERGREYLLNSILWQLKLNGAAITEEEIETYRKLTKI